MPPSALDLATFDYKDPEALKEALLSGKTQAEIAVLRGVDPSTISKWVSIHRSGGGHPQDRRLVYIREADVKNERAVHELVEYFKGRTVPTGRPPDTKSSDRKYAREVIGSDLHAPLHHEGAWEVFLAAIEYLQPEGVTLDGDALDMAMISRFVKRPKAVRQLQTDLDWARENVFARVNAVAPNAKKTFVLGNHEGERWERYLWERCSEIAELRCLDMEALLGLSEMGWYYEPDGYELVPDTFLVDHGDRHTSQLGGGSAMSARKEMIDTGLSGCSGHTHKLGKFYRFDNAGYRVWCELGCLCNAEVMREHRVTAHKRGHKVEDWHLGFGVVYHHVGGHSFDIKDVPILTEGKRTFCILHGEEIAA